MLMHAKTGYGDFSATIDRFLLPFTRDQFADRIFGSAFAHLTGLEADNLVATYADVEFALRSALENNPSSIDIFVPSPETDGASCTQLGLSQGNLDRVLSALNAGSTVRLREPHRLVRSLLEWKERLEATFECNVGCNLYWSFVNAAGLGAHIDLHDVFACQIHGTKTWTISEPPVRRPYENPTILNFDSKQTSERVADPAPGRPLFDARSFPRAEKSSKIELHAGQRLYLPRGYVHSVASNNTQSIHVTFGIQSLTWADLVAVALRCVAFRDSSFRESLPLGIISGSANESAGDAFEALVQKLASKASLDEALVETAHRFSSSRTKLSRGWLKDRSTSLSVDEHTLVVRSSAGFAKVVIDESDAVLLFPGNWVSGPLELTAAFRRMLEPTPFTACDLPGPITKASKLVVIRRLVQEGFLTSLESENG